MFHTNKATQGLLLAALLTTAACDRARYTEALSPAGNITRIIIQVDAGSLELVSSDSLRVERTIRAPEGALELSHRVEYVSDGEETLYLTAHCAPLIPCAVDTRVSVPEGIPVEVELSRGEVWATGIGALSLEIGRGDADVDIDGPLMAHIGDGSILASLPELASARVAVGHGDITLQVPGGDWQVDVSAAHLVMDEQITLSDDGGGELELVAPAGNVTINTSQPYALVR